MLLADERTNEKIFYNVRRPHYTFLQLHKLCLPRTLRGQEKFFDQGLGYESLHRLQWEAPWKPRFDLRWTHFSHDRRKTFLPLHCQAQNPKLGYRHRLRALVCLEPWKPAPAI